MVERAAVPRWFLGVSVLLLLWSFIGVAAFVAELNSADPAVRALPGWFVLVFALAVFPALLGALAMLARRRWAEPLALLSLAGIVAQFGYVLGVTDIIARQGLASAATLPAVIFAVALAQWRLAALGRRRGWLG